jgi:hypothetical protein
MVFAGVILLDMLLPLFRFLQCQLATAGAAMLENDCSFRLYELSRKTQTQGDLLSLPGI